MARSIAPGSAASGPRKKDADAGAPARRAKEDAAALASYIADMASELSQLAGRSEMQMVAYFLDLARIEAELQSREIASRPVEPEK
ncbi:MAG TPA: hypothetical protein VIF34_02520 [Methylocystis sp.]|jgi:hypothetical protein